MPTPASAPATGGAPKKKASSKGKKPSGKGKKKETVADLKKEAKRRGISLSTNGKEKTREQLMRSINYDKNKKKTKKSSSKKKK